MRNGGKKLSLHFLFIKFFRVEKNLYTNCAHFLTLATNFHAKTYRCLCKTFVEGQSQFDMVFGVMLCYLLYMSLLFYSWLIFSLYAILYRDE